MITLKVDEGYAYDFLSILEVKYNKGLPNSEHYFKSCLDHIKSQIGEDKNSKILNSLEYKSLLNTNSETFDAVEKARYGSISAKEVDDLNMNRFFCKKSLQNKFFPENQIFELKT